MFEKSSEREAWRKKIFASDFDESQFNDAALELFFWQSRVCPPYQKLVSMHRVKPNSVCSWREIPAVAQSLFKEFSFYSHGDIATAKTIFHTSGTTTGIPGKHYFKQIDLYNAAALEGALRAGLLTEEMELHFLTSDPSESIHSSLSCMFGFWEERWGNEQSCFWIKKGKIDFHLLKETLSGASAIGATAQDKKTFLKSRLVQKSRAAIGLCGTAFSFVHWIDQFSQSEPVALPQASWIVETGGFKGRSREILKEEFYQGLSYLFGVPIDHIWNEYGMTELSSQAYARGIEGIHRVPPWVRVIMIDPKTQKEAKPGEVGLIRWIDLANIDSVLAIQTLDQGVAGPENDGQSFYLIGRVSEAEPRGCSLDAERLRKRFEFPEKSGE